MDLELLLTLSFNLASGQPRVLQLSQQMLFYGSVRDITNATIREAPIELTDDTMIAALSNFGHIVPQSMRRGKVRGTNILTGTRYVQINDVVNTIPTEIEV